MLNLGSALLLIPLQKAKIGVSDISLKISYGTKHQTVGTIFMVTDMEASLRFYREGLGFKLTNQWTPRDKIEWCWLERDAVALMLQEPRQLNAEQSGVLGGGITICYQCADALALYHEFTAKNITLQEPFVGNGLWIVALKDPDGYRLEFASPTDVAEETIYTEWVKSV